MSPFTFNEQIEEEHEDLLLSKTVEKLGYLKIGFPFVKITVTIYCIVPDGRICF